MWQTPFAARSSVLLQCRLNVCDCGAGYNVCSQVDCKPEELSSHLSFGPTALAAQIQRGLLLKVTAMIVVYVVWCTSLSNNKNLGHKSSVGLGRVHMSLVKCTLAAA